MRTCVYILYIHFFIYLYLPYTYTGVQQRYSVHYTLIVIYTKLDFFYVCTLGIWMNNTNDAIRLLFWLWLLRRRYLWLLRPISCWRRWLLNGGLLNGGLFYNRLLYNRLFYDWLFYDWLFLRLLFRYPWLKFFGGTCSDGVPIFATPTARFIVAGPT